MINIGHKKRKRKRKAKKQMLKEKQRTNNRQTRRGNGKTRKPYLITPERRKGRIFALNEGGIIESND